MRAPDYPPIQDYALIGDCGSAALVSRYGSIDWLCWPKFDSPSIFAALLDRRRGGCFSIRPAGDYEVERTYLEGTNVLETTFRTEGGLLHLTDLMPVSATEEYDRELRPDHEVLRCVTCERGSVELEIVFEPRFDYGRKRVRLEDRGEHGYFANHRSEVLVFRSEIPVTLTADGDALTGRYTMQAGERRFLAAAFDLEEPSVMPVLGDFAERRLEQTIDYWREWSGKCRYDGPFRDAVVRSALTLKLMTYARSGAVVAAPTTSLPERVGGERNWDYRFCWLRDASMTLRVLFELGYSKEAEAFLEWLLHAMGGRQSDLQILYDVYGGSHMTERELDHLEGYRGSRPVRVGNDAKDQLQLDIYGELVSGAYEYFLHEGGLSKAHRKELQRLGEVVCERWKEPDHGIWEKRGEPRHHTYSKAMCWVALDRLLTLHEKDDLDVPVERFKKVQEEIRDEIEARGFNDRLQCYVSVYDSDEVDASLLLLPMYGYADARSDRMQSTFRCIEEHLGVDSLMYRYRAEHTDDGLGGEEGAFGICSFWDEAFLALSGRVEEAKERLEGMMRYANDVGLFAEEIDPETGGALGNFPQAFTHVGLINAALTIAAVERGEIAGHLDGTTADQPAR